MKIVAFYETYDQCSPDDFERNRHIKEINGETTINDILKWQKEDPMNQSYYRKKIFEGNDFIPFTIYKLE